MTITRMICYIRANCGGKNRLLPARIKKWQWTNTCLSLYLLCPLIILSCGLISDSLATLTFVVDFPSKNNCCHKFLLHWRDGKNSEEVGGGGLSPLFIHSKACQTAFSSGRVKTSSRAGFREKVKWLSDVFSKFQTRSVCSFKRRKLS